MKKLILLSLVAIFVVSCQGPVGPEGPQGAGTNWKIINLVANKSDWVNNPDPNGKFYSCHFSMPEITSSVFNDGAVITYLLDNTVQQPLPYTRHFQNTAGNFTRTVDFDYSEGGINVYVTNSDFAVDPPISMNFRVVLTW